MHEDPTKCICQGYGSFKEAEPLNWLEIKYIAYDNVITEPVKIKEVKCIYHHPDSDYYQYNKANKQMEKEKAKLYKAAYEDVVYWHGNNPYQDLGVVDPGTKSNMPETMWYLSEKELNKIEPETNIDYPDGWLEEDLRLWCKDRGVSLPKYLKEKKVKYKPYTGGKVSGQILFSGTIKIPAPKFHSQLYGFTIDSPKYPYWIPNPKDTTYTVYFGPNDCIKVSKEELNKIKASLSKDKNES